MLEKLREVGAAGKILAAAEACVGWSLEDVVTDAPGLHTNRVAQPLICISQLAAWEAIRHDLARPVLFAGYSVGELAAYACAGSLTAESLARLAVLRARVMDEAAGAAGALVAVRDRPVDALMQLCEQCDVEIAIVNGADHVVVGGLSPAIETFSERAAARGFHVTPLAVTVPAHTSLLWRAIDRFRIELERSPMSDPRTPVLAGITGLPIRTRAAAIEHLARQVAEPVQWARCIETAVEMGCTAFVELGPGRALSKMMLERYPHVQARSIEEFRSLAAVGRWVGKVL